jgi:hypothetical protein
VKPGETIEAPHSELHTVGPAGDEDVEMVAELRPVRLGAQRKLLAAMERVARRLGYHEDP